MNTHRVLLLHDDLLLLNLYREKLEASGFAVDATCELERVPNIVAARVPDVVLLDLVLRRGSALDFIKSWRRNPATGGVQILILPTALSDIASEAVQAGARQVIEPGANPIASIISAVKMGVGMPGLGDAAAMDLFKPEGSWADAILSGTAEHINHMRHCIPGISGASPEPAALRELWALVHGFAEKARFLPSAMLAQFGEVFDYLLHDLNEAPGLLNPSTLRTVGQAIDFLGTIANAPALKRLGDPASARVLAVDDEPTALLVISAALQLGGLTCETANSAANGLEKAGEAHWDLIFLDIGLPQVDGFELCTKLRAMENIKATPLVFITGLATFQNKAKACLSGGNDFVAKPFNLPELAVKALTWVYRGTGRGDLPAC